MKTITIFVLTAALAALMAACGAPAGNTGTNANAATNSNANMAKPVAAAPTKDALLDLDKKANEAWFKNDSAFFDGFLSDKFVGYDNGKRSGKADVLKMLASSKCDIKTWSLDDAQMVMIDVDTYVLSYKGTFDGTCNGPDGKTMKVPSPIRAASVVVRNGDKWQGVFHGENPILDGKTPPPPAAKKDADKKADAKPADKAMANSNTAQTKPAAPAADANTDALVKLHNGGWEAWKAKDAKKLEDMTASNLSEVDPAGMWFGTKADVIKQWTVDMKCEGITKTSFTEGVATALSPTVEVLTGKGMADGTCGGQKNGPLYQTAFYVKEGDAWKLAFMFESLPGGMGM